MPRGTKKRRGHIGSASVLKRVPSAGYSEKDSKDGTNYRGFDDRTGAHWFKAWHSAAHSSFFCFSEKFEKFVVPGQDSAEGDMGERRNPKTTLKKEKQAFEEKKSANCMSRQQQKRKIFANPQKGQRTGGATELTQRVSPTSSNEGRPIKGALKEIRSSRREEDRRNHYSKRCSSISETSSVTLKNKCDSRQGEFYHQKEQQGDGLGLVFGSRKWGKEELGCRIHGERKGVVRESQTKQKKKVHERGGSCSRQVKSYWQMSDAGRGRLKPVHRMQRSARGEERGLSLKERTDG